MWLALRTEIALEFHALQPTMWDAWDMHTPTRTESDRLVDARAERKRKVSTLLAVGKVREARRRESHLRAWKRRRACKR
jgi:hypothetical protein